MTNTPPSAGLSERPVRVAGAHRPIVVLGLALILLFIGGIVFNRVVGTSVTRSPGHYDHSTGGQDTVTTTRSAIPGGVLLGLLSSGGVFVLVGLLWSRITVIKLLGSEIDLSDNEKRQALDRIQQHVNERGLAPEKATAAALESYRLLLAEKQQTVATVTPPELTLSESKIGALVDQAVTNLD